MVRTAPISSATNARRSSSNTSSCSPSSSSPSPRRSPRPDRTSSRTTKTNARSSCRSTHEPKGASYDRFRDQLHDPRSRDPRWNRLRRALDPRHRDRARRHRGVRSATRRHREQGAGHRDPDRQHQIALGALDPPSRRPAARPFRFPPEECMSFVYLALALAILVTGVAAAHDWRTGHIPNWLTLGSMALGAVVHAAYGASTGGARAVVGSLMSVVIGIVVCSLVP